jgi:hypothetical protein
MRISKVYAMAAMSALAVGLLAGCSGSSSTGMSPAVPTSHMRQAVSRDMTGVAPKYLESIRLGGAHVPATRPGPATGGHRLAVSDFGTGAVEVLDLNTYAPSYTVTTGLSGPDGDWYDQAGNLYVGNYGGVGIQEYPAGGSTPSFAYTTSLTDPIGVTTDEAGNVYAADYQGDQVVEFPQGSNTPSHACPVAGGAENVAVKENGKVFVDLNFSAGGAGVVEFPNGLSNCGSEVTLISSLSFAGGMQLDNSNNLVVEDQLCPCVDIIDKPNYNTINQQITAGFSDPFHVALNRYNTLMYVADVGNANVQVLTYPGGSPVTTLNGANGLSDPAGIATHPFVH